LALFGLAFAMHVLRHLAALLAAPLGIVAQTVLAETVHAGVGVLILAATVIEMRGAPPRRTLLALWGGMAVALALLVPLYGADAASVAMALFVGAVLLAAAVALQFRAARAPGAGYRLVAALFAMWGAVRLVAPLLADLHGLAPQLVIGAGLDCLLDDSLRLAARLRAAGNSVHLSVHDGVPHSFMQLSAHLEPADAALHEAAGILATAFSQWRNRAAA